MSEEHVSDEDAEGSISEDEASPAVADEISDAKDAHKAQADDSTASEGQGVERAVMGYAAPDTGQEDAVESEVPEGVDALTDEQIQAAEERGGGGGDEDDAGALDVSELMQEGGADEAGEDADEEA